MYSGTSSIYSTYPTEYNKYIMDPTNEIVSLRGGGRGGSSKILTYKDGTEWVVLTDKPKERFSGFLYLQKVLEDSGADKILPAENIIALINKKIIYLSKYCGEERLKYDDTETFQALAIIEGVGFRDTVGGANLRKVGDKIFIFDTEKNSFKSSVSEKIHSFDDMHDAIRSMAEERFKTCSEEKKNK